MSRPISLRLILAQSSAAVFEPAVPALFCFFDALHLGGTSHDQARISVLAIDPTNGQWQQHVREVTLAQTLRIVAALDAVGLPDRHPEVDAVVDTSNGWDHILFWVRSFERTRSVSIQMNSSGFEGRDSDGLRDLFTSLFALPVSRGSRRTSTARHQGRGDENSNRGDVDNR